MIGTQTHLTPQAMDAKSVSLFNQFLRARERQLRGRMELDMSNPNWPAKRHEILVVKKVFDDFLNGKLPDFDLINQEGVK